MHRFTEQKTKFFNFLNKIGQNDKKIGIVSHANCIDGLASAVFMVEILKNKYPLIETNVFFIAYTAGVLDKISDNFKNNNIKKVFVLDLNVDVTLFDEFENFRKRFEVCFIDHHPLSDKLIIDENIIKTESHDCTSLTLFIFGDKIIEYKEWSWLACVAAISEFSHKNEDNLKLIKSYYPSFDINNIEDSDIFKIVNKIGSLVIYYSKDSFKAYEILLNKENDKIENIHNEVASEMERCLKDFDDNAENCFDGHLYFYFFSSKFPLGSKLSSILSVRHKWSTIVIFSETDINKIKVSARNNSDSLVYSMNDMLKAGISGLDNALAGGHAAASGATFLRKDIDRFKEQVKGFVKSKI